MTTKSDRPRYSTTICGGIAKIVERGGVVSLWKGSTSCIHRFPFTVINFYCCETVSGLLNRREDLPATSQRLLAGAIAARHDVDRGLLPVGPGPDPAQDAARRERGVPWENQHVCEDREERRGNRTVFWTRANAHGRRTQLLDIIRRVRVLMNTSSRTNCSTTCARSIQRPAIGTR